jgi:hypothetical protein
MRDDDVKEWKKLINPDDIDSPFGIYMYIYANIVIGRC